MDAILSIDYIVSDPAKRGGRPRIAGKGITVHDIAWDYNNGLSVEYIVEAFGLTPAQIYAALSYYFDHKEQIDQEIRLGEEEANALMEELERQGKAESMEAFRKRLEARMAERKTD